MDWHEWPSPEGTEGIPISLFLYAWRTPGDSHKQQVTFGSSLHARIISATPTSINLPSNTFHQIHQLFSGRGQSPGFTGSGGDRSGNPWGLSQVAGNIWLVPPCISRQCYTNFNKPTLKHFSPNSSTLFRMWSKSRVHRQWNRQEWNTWTWLGTLTSHR